MSDVVVVSCSFFFALALHLVAQVFAAKAVGGEGVRLRLAFPLLRVDATLPDGKINEVVFLVAGAFANAGGAGSLLSTSDERLHVAGIVQVVVAVLTLVPVGGSDGARLLR